MEPIKQNQVYGLWPADIEGIDSLMELALNMRWSWNHSADKLFKELDPDLWELTRNPWIVLQTVSHDQLALKMALPAFRDKINELMKLKEAAASSAAWFQQKHPDSELTNIAYFSMEFMLSEALPIYSGGLGNVAGDQLKSASDLGVPVVGVGLLYQQGYFHQVIDKSDNQLALFPYNDPGQLPITPLRLKNGEWLRIKINFPGFPVWLRTWQVQVGRLKLYLLDSNDAANLPVYRGITNELYGGGSNMRIQQEILLGIGGWRLLKAIGIKPEVCHMNEGHSAFLVLERAHDYMDENHVSFEEALAVIRKGNLFTTHTAVPAGFDHFNPELMEKFLGSYVRDDLKIEMKEFMALGRQNPYDSSESFNMAYLALRCSGAVNGVSELHGKVSQTLFKSLFPRWPVDEVPVGHVTNGVHMPSWDSEIADKLWTEAAGKDRWRGDLESLEQDISALTDEELWNMRCVSRKDLVDIARNRFENQLQVSGVTADQLKIAKSILDPETLTLGFARRFVPYKRPNLLLSDPARFINILTNQQHPVQLLIAGKAPPFDESGKALIREWIKFIEQNNLHKHIVFLSDYDMFLTENMVQGADVWVNTPRRPWEACGTSGMKVLVNGGINLSELDGWWAEAYSPEVGWALGDMQQHGNDPEWDRIEADNLYEILEKQVVPDFYNRNERGIPEKWIEKMRNSMGKLTPRFSANRTVREYTEKYYLPAASGFLKRSSDKAAVGKQIVDLTKELASKWAGIKFDKTEIIRNEKGFTYEVSVFLNNIDPGNVQVQLYADGIDEKPAEIIIMEPKEKNGEEKAFYAAEVTTVRLANDYTARVVPHYLGISVPLENGLICWQR
ncbi:MAG: alpha-glucan family phosphorylase [Bacteroidota bacterium]|nr:alpha-glucan family phosphorylase [Bacteroidota bacterium]